jgi:large subunit ribosomal protein L25
METVTLSVKKRDKTGSRPTKVLRDQGMVPAVLYGHGEESVAFAIPLKTMEDCLKKNIRIMKLDFGDASDQALIKDFQWDTFGEDLLHIDLIRVRMDEVVSMSVSLESEGRAKGVEEGGILDMPRSSITVKCVPTNIPDVLVFNVSDLGIGDSLHIKDIVLPEGVELDDDPDQVVAAVAARVEIVEEEAEPVEGEEGEAPEEGDAPADAPKDDKGGE